MSDTELIEKVAVIPALDQNGHQVAPGELITFDPSKSRDPKEFVKKLNASKAFRDPGKGKVRPVQADIFPGISGGPSHTATPPVVPPKDGETGGIPLQTLGLPQSIVEGIRLEGTEAVEEEGTQRATAFDATSVVEGNVDAATASIGELTTAEQLDAVIEAEKARDKGNRTGVLDAVEARRAVLNKGD